MPIGGPLATAIDSVWERIRLRHPDVPEAVVAVASGSQGRGRSVRRGHFGPDRWERAGVWMPELFVGAEGLAAGAREVLGTLLHEAAHGIATTRGIGEASDNGRYHNKKFQALADEVGLSTARHQRLGWSLTTVPDETAGRFTAELRMLERAIVAHRRPEHSSEDSDHTAAGEGEDDSGEEGASRRSKARDRNGQPLTCGCEPPRRIRAHKKIIDAGPILCGLCTTPFGPSPD
ncbi:hypothetical protein ACWDYH_38445 [Nocardia goodfellowii]